MKEKNNFDNFIRDLESIKMTQAEKTNIQANLESFVGSYTPKPSPYQVYLPAFKGALAFALLLVISVPLSRPISQAAIPGDTLYPVKILHEKIELNNIKEPEKKINLAIKQTQKRIQEAVKLAESEKLDNNTQEKIAEDIKKQVSTINKEIKKIKREKPEKALSLNADLKNTLKLNSTALQKAAQEKPEKAPKPELPTETAGDIENNVKEKEASPDQKPQQKKERAEEKTKENIILKSLKEDIQEVEKNDIEIKHEISEKLDVKNTEAVEQETKKIEEVKEVKEKDSTEPEEIISSTTEETENTNENQTSEKPELPSSETEGLQELNTERASQEKQIATELIKLVPAKTINSDEPLQKDTDIDVSQEKEAETPTEAEKTVVTASLTSTEKTISAPNESIQKELEKEISSLEKVLFAQEELSLILLKNNIPENTEKNIEIKNLISHKKFGKALILIQDQINLIKESALEKEIEMDLGIEITKEDNENLK